VRSCFKFLLVLAFSLSSVSCQHYCENYIDCDARLSALRKQLVSLQEENRRLRLFAVEQAQDRCDIR
jgi:hypothetical protein